MPALALTDHGNLFGAVEFYDTAHAAGVKPIIGCEVYVAHGARARPDAHGRRHAALTTTWSCSRETARATGTSLKLSSAGYLEGFHYKPRIDKELLAAHAGGLLCLSACLRGEVPQLVRGRRHRGSAEGGGLVPRSLRRPSTTSSRSRTTGSEDEKTAAGGLIELSRSMGIPLVATNDCHYLAREDAEAHEVLLCIQTGKTMLDQDRFRFTTDQLYVKSPEEMAALFGETPEALQQHARRGGAVRADARHRARAAPGLPDPARVRERGGLPPPPRARGARAPVPGGRSPRRSSGASTTSWTRSARSATRATSSSCATSSSTRARTASAWGPGAARPRGASSPTRSASPTSTRIRFELLFERFLNPERVSMPDIDIDFAYEDRQKVIDYVVGKYGRDSVSQIITFGTMAARAVVRDVARALGMTFAEGDKVAKMVPADLGMTPPAGARDRARAQGSRSRTSATRGSFAARMALEGLARHASTHAAGVLIAPGALTEHVPMYRSPKGDLTTQFDMKSLERVGLLKMDFLGLRTLTVLEQAVELAHATTGVSVDLGSLPLDDPDTYALLQKAQTVGIFQLESAGHAGSPPEGAARTPSRTSSRSTRSSARAPSRAG